MAAVSVILLNITLLLLMHKGVRSLLMFLMFTTLCCWVVQSIKNCIYKKLMNVTYNIHTFEFYIQEIFICKVTYT